MATVHQDVQSASDHTVVEQECQVACKWLQLTTT